MTEHLPPASTPGSVVLDIGESAGALVVYADSVLAGVEVEIRPCGQAWRGVHTAVRPRHVAGGDCWAGVFGSLPPGAYDLRVRKDPAAAGCITARVSAGSVSEVHLPA